MCVCERGEGEGLSGLEDLNGEGVLWWSVNSKGGSRELSVCVCMCVRVEDD